MALTDETNKTIPRGKMRIYCVRLEAYDLAMGETRDLETKFEVLFAQCEGKPEIAQMLLQLGESIESNRREIEKNL